MTVKHPTDDELREVMVEKLNRLIASSKGLPIDTLPKNVHLLSPNLDVQRLADDFLALLSERERLADINGRVDELRQVAKEVPTTFVDGYVAERIASLEASKPEEKEQI